MKILVCGGRDFEDWKKFNSVMYDIVFGRTGTPNDVEMLPTGIEIIAGGATGADSLAIEWAIANWVPFIEYPADWKQYGKKAGYIRNKQMLEEGKPDLVVAFPGGRGTANMIKLAEEAGVEVIRVE